MTLLAAADPAEAQTGAVGRNVFRAVLAKYFGGVPDKATLARLLRHRRPGQGATQRNELRAAQGRAKRLCRLREQPGSLLCGQGLIVLSRVRAGSSH
jgi:hypothetical protein